LQCFEGFDFFCIPPNIHPKRIGTHPGNASEKSASPGQRAERHGLFDRVNMTGGAFAIVRGCERNYLCKAQSKVALGG